MSFTRRQWLKLTAAAGGAAMVPRGLEAANRATRQNPVALTPTTSPRQRLRLDTDWRFALGHASDPAKDFGYGQGRVFDKVGQLFVGSTRTPGPSHANFDAAAWRPVTLPHDWAVELPFENAAELNDFGYKPLGRNFPATSVGWYRRVFDVPASDNGRRVAIEFDGVFRDAIVVLNGHLLGTNASGYSPFRFDVTDLVTYGGRNVLVVRVDATGREGWFYEGAGIYRNVWLEKTSPLHVAHWGTFVQSEVAAGAAQITLVTDVVNDSDEAAACLVASTIVGEGDRTVAKGNTERLSVPARGRRAFEQRFTVRAPALWSPDTPHLYRAMSLVQTPAATDDYVTPFGIRTIRFDANEGFFLNGRRLELKGTCNHQDHAGVGSALPDRLHEYRVERLKAMGSNAYRTAHNPPAPELLDACDRLGMLVLDETRFFSSGAEGLSQVERMVRRDRNHPSVFAWSIGNEEWAVQANDRGRRIAESIRRAVRAIDSTRPVTAGMDSGYENGSGITLALDVQGFNYQRESLDNFHRKYPNLPSMGTEVASAYSTRGIYDADKDRGYVSAYDVNKPSYAATAEEWWTFYAARRHLAGGFIWTGFDYRGEPSPYRWPCISSHFGVLDTCGFPKDSFFYYQAWWTDRAVLHLFPHWNWAGREGQDIDVWCHTNCEAVELFVNGTSAGMRTVARNSHVSWKVPYAPGVIEARGVLAGNRIAAKRETTGAPARIVLAPDRARVAADGRDVSVVEVQIVDAQGRLVPTASNEVRFAVTGGRLIGVGNGDPSSHESDKADSRRAFNGLCAAIVQSPAGRGDIRVEATSAGVDAGTTIVSAV